MRFLFSASCATLCWGILALLVVTCNLSTANAQPLPITTPHHLTHSPCDHADHIAHASSETTHAMGCAHQQDCSHALCCVPLMLLSGLNPLQPIPMPRQHADFVYADQLTLLHRALPDQPPKPSRMI